MTPPVGRRHDPRVSGWALASVVVAVLAGLDMARGGMPYFRDRLYYFLPQYTACRDALAGGEIPLWNPYVNCGQPLLATWQQGLFSPLSLPFLLFSWETAWRWFWPAALGIAAAGMFALGLRAGLAPAGAGIAAVAYALSGPLRGMGEWPNITASLALLPALLAAVAGMAAGARGGAAAVAVLGALQLLCGQPRQILIAALAATGWLAAVRAPRRIWIALAGAATVALLLSAAQLGPTVAFTVGSERVAAGVPPATVAESFLTLPDAVTLIGGRIYGTEDLGTGPGRHLMPPLTLGWTGLLFVCAGLTAAGPVRRFAAVTIPVALLASFGGPHVETLLRLLGGPEPVLRYFGHFILAGWPALALLAGAGAVRLQGGTPGAPVAALAAGLVATLWWSPLAGPVLAAVADPGPAFRAARLAEIRIDAIAGGVAAGIAALAAIASRRRGAGATAARVLAAALALELWWAIRHHEAKGAVAAFAPGPVADALTAGGDRVFIPIWVTPILGDGAAGTLTAQYAARAQGLSPNVGLAARVGNAWGYEPLAPAAAGMLFGRWNGRCASVATGVRATGVRWIIGPDDPVTRPAGWTARARVAGVWHLFEAPEFVPPVRVIPETQAGRPWQTIADAGVIGTARITARTWNSVTIAARAAAPGRLLTGSPELPGWIARIGTTRVALGPAGDLFQSLRVPAGASTVRLAYRPLSFALGLWLACLALAAVLARSALQ